MKQKSPLKTEKVYAFGPAQYAYDAKEPIFLGMEITNLDFVPKIISGELRGLSTAYIVRKWKCSICNGDLEECSHEVGKKYGNVTCHMIANDVEITDISVVDVPKDPRCRITDMLIIRNGNHPEFIWYGFRVNTEMDRFKNIQRALDNGLIPEKAALFFGKFFSTSLEGKIVFPSTLLQSSSSPNILNRNLPKSGEAKTTRKSIKAKKKIPKSADTI